MSSIGGMTPYDYISDENPYKRRRVDTSDGRNSEPPAGTYEQYSTYGEISVQQSYCGVESQSQSTVGSWEGTIDTSTNANFAEVPGFDTTVSAPSEQVCFGMVSSFRTSVATADF